MNFATTILIVLLLAAGSIPAQAQAPLSPEEARALEYGKEIYKVKANCQFCHKWDASGDTGYGGIALSLRKTALTPEQFTEVVKCGRPGTGINAPAVTYAVNGKQYVAVLVGSRQALNVWQHAPELKNTATASMLYVFEQQ